MRRYTKTNLEYFNTLSLTQLYEFKSKYLLYIEEKIEISKNQSERILKFKNLTRPKVTKLLELHSQYVEFQNLLSLNRASVLNSIIGKSINYLDVRLNVFRESKVCSDSYTVPDKYERTLEYFHKYLGSPRSNRRAKPEMLSEIEKMNNVRNEIIEIQKSIAKDELELMTQLKEIKPILAQSIVLKFGKFEEHIYFRGFTEEKIQKRINKIENEEILRAKAAASDNKQRELSASIKTKIKHQINIYPNCPYCDALLDMKCAHADHIYPVQKGGHSTSKNMVYVCDSCNLSKGNSTLRKFIKKNKLNEQKIYHILECLHKEF